MSSACPGGGDPAPEWAPPGRKNQLERVPPALLDRFRLEGVCACVCSRELGGRGVPSSSTIAPLDAPKSCITTSAGPVLALFLLTPHFLTEPMRDKSGVLDPPLPGVASREEDGIIATISGEDALSLSGVEGGNGGDDESRCSSMSSNTLLSILGGRDFLRRRRRSRWGGEGGM